MIVSAFSAMNRRKFIGLVGGMAALWPRMLRAQQYPVIGFLSPASSAAHGSYVSGFQQGLSESGYVDGRNVTIDYRWADDQLNRLPGLAAQLVERRVSIIVASASSAAAIAAKERTETIPIVFVIGADPVKLRLVDSLNRPGTNVTGVSSLLNTLMAKRLELLCELIPTAKVIGVLINPNNPNAEADAESMKNAGLSLGREIRIGLAKGEGDFDPAIASLVAQKATAMLVVPDTLFSNRRSQLVGLAERYGLPVIYSLREFTVAGGLLSYGPSFVDAHRQAGLYAGRILRGEKPAELPVFQATRFELVLNQRTAKNMGLMIPEQFLARADEIIE
jgi:putative ABC transport system substrate-binding protein